MAAAGLNSDPEPTYFDSAQELRAWFDANGADLRVLTIAFRKPKSGLPSVTYLEAVNEALCFGWIDGVRRSIDADTYTGRFTPRKARSYWSAVNIRRAHELEEQGRMTPAGLAAFAQRNEAETDRYSFERASVAFTPEQEERFRADADAWAWFNVQPPSYQRPATHYVTSAKQESTRLRRLEQLIEDSAAGRRIGPLRRRGIDMPLARERGKAAE
jgi:uncharacterized protein YdeI (YjbR/CyaY-like superfamily)